MNAQHSFGRDDEQFSYIEERRRVWHDIKIFQFKKSPFVCELLVITILCKVESENHLRDMLGGMTCHKYGTAIDFINFP